MRLQGWYAALDAASSRDGRSVFVFKIDDNEAIRLFLVVHKENEVVKAPALHKADAESKASFALRCPVVDDAALACGFGLQIEHVQDTEEITAKAELP
jgi:hypothetical protein